MEGNRRGIGGDQHKGSQDLNLTITSEANGRLRHQKFSFGVFSVAVVLVGMDEWGGRRECPVAQ